MSFPVTVGLDNGDEKVTSSSDRGRALGTKAQTPDGRIFRWSLSGSVAIEAGLTVQTPAGDSNSTAGLAVVNTSATGVTTITVTLADAVTKDQYKDGYIYVDASPGQGVFKIKENAAQATTNGNALFTLQEDDPIRDAMTSGTTTVGLRQNPYRNVIATPATVTGSIVGATTAPVSSATYFWAQTAGWGLAEGNGALAVDTPLVHSSVGKVAAQTTDNVQPFIGWAVDEGTNTATSFNFVKWTME